MNSIVFEESIDRFFADTENISYNDLNCPVNLESDGPKPDKYHSIEMVTQCHNHIIRNRMMKDGLGYLVFSIQRHKVIN